MEFINKIKNLYKSIVNSTLFLALVIFLIVATIIGLLVLTCMTKWGFIIIVVAIIFILCLCTATIIKEDDY